MKRTLIYGLMTCLVMLFITIGISYEYSRTLRRELAEIWKQTLWEDCKSRMREINARKVKAFTPTDSPDIFIMTEAHTSHFKKNANQPLTDYEKDFIADQIYLSSKNPVKIEKLDSLFRKHLEEKGLYFETVVMHSNEMTGNNRMYDETNERFLHEYLRLPHKVDFQDKTFLEGYVKGNWLENMLWGKTYYILLLSASAGILVCLLINLKNRKLSDKPTNLKNTKEEIQPTALQAQPARHIIVLDKKKNTITCDGKEMALTPKIFGLFYQLMKGDDYFQSYDFLLETLWSEKESGDKKSLEQLITRLRKELQDIIWLNIKAVRGSGYQISGENGDIAIDVIENV